MSTPKTTKQWYFSKLESLDYLTLGQTEVPEPKATEVLVKIHAASLMYRDLLVANGTYPLPGKLPVVPLSDAACEVVALGSDVERWAIGDRVCANFWLDHLYGPFQACYAAKALGAVVNGVLTQYRVFPAHSLVKIPKHLSYEEASTLPCAALTAYNALYGQTPLRAGESVLVLGTGGVSIFALQFAVAAGAIVIATSSSDEKLEVVRKLGARHVINYKKTPDWEREVLRLTDGHGVNHVIEVGGEGTLQRSMKSLAFGGTVHDIGLLAGDGDLKGIPRALMFKNAMMHGVSAGSRELFEHMNQLIAAQELRPVVDKVFRFDEAKQAYEYFASRKHVGKVVLRVAGP